MDYFPKVFKNRYSGLDLSGTIAFYHCFEYSFLKLLSIFELTVLKTPFTGGTQL